MWDLGSVLDPVEFTISALELSKQSMQSSDSLCGILIAVPTHGSVGVIGAYRVQNLGFGSIFDDQVENKREHKMEIRLFM